ncbi:hypothetical protein ABT124_31400 [Streptomyces sp. NPDC001982]|uniref:hypothetical protein n=1 Tax=Streptomyces sp. NPDC001982 TaxID=3154405 RepID=UPI00332A1B9A
MLENAGGDGMRWWTGVWLIAGVMALAACGGTAGDGTDENHASSTAACATGHVQVTVSPGDPVTRRLCVRPGTVVSLVLQPRTDDARWTGVHSSAPVFVLPEGWRRDTDGTAHTNLRCAGVRAGAAVVTASAKAPDVAGAPHIVFTLDVIVVPYGREG